MAKVFRPSSRESSILSKIESSKEYARRQVLNGIRECIDPLSNEIAMKLVENQYIETTSKTNVQDEIHKCLESMSRSDDFDIDYAIAPLRNLVANPHIISLYLTVFVIEKLINHKNVIDVYGSDDEIYACINRQVTKYLPMG